MARIMVVDDDPGVRSILLTLLEREGHQAEAAGSVAEAMSLLEQGPFELLLCDLNMPDESGLDLLAKLQPRMPDVAALMVSVIDSPDVARRCLDLGAYGYIAKPFEPNEININVACALKRRQLELDNRKNQQTLELLASRRTAALVESERRYRTLVQTITEGLVSLDAEGRLSFFNDRFAQMLGYHPNELRDIRMEDLVSPSDREDLAARLSQGPQPDEDEEAYELSFSTKSGDKIITMVYPRTLGDPQGRRLGYQALITDVTEQRVMEAQMHQAQKLESIGQLAAGIAHEINTPTQYVADNISFLQKWLGSLIAILQGHRRCRRMILEQADPREVRAELEDLAEREEQARLDFLLEEIPRAMEESQEGMGRIGAIVRSMKEFAHPGQGVMTPVNLNGALESTITVARNEWKYVAEVKTDFDPDLPTVICLPGELNQVFLNILINSAQAIAEKVGDSSGMGRIELSTSRDGEWVEVRIADDGPGVPPDIRDKVFDPFFTTKPPGKGTGQGLAIAHRVVVEKHGGKLRLEGNPAGGATFVVCLPLSPRSDQA